MKILRSTSGMLYSLCESFDLDLVTGLPRPSWVADGCRKWIDAHPHCAACGGTVMLNAHHILPWSWPGGTEKHNSDPLAVPAVFVTLCEKPSMACHLWIGHLGDYKSRNPNVLQDAATFSNKVKHRPYPRTP